MEELRIPVIKAYCFYRNYRALFRFEHVLSGSEVLFFCVKTDSTVVHFMTPEYSLPYAQNPVSGPYTELQR